MGTRRRKNRRCGWLAATALLSACASHAETATETSAAPTSTSIALVPPTTTSPPPPQTVNWFDLDVGQCLADPPPVDPTVISVAIIDCASPHRAEVYLRAPMAVNTAIADVIDRTCGQGYTDYTGHTVGDGAYSTTYLIDSNQNRTSSNPNPSTVICLLEAPDGGLLTSPARG